MGTWSRGSPAAASSADGGPGAGPAVARTCEFRWHGVRRCPDGAAARRARSSRPARSAARLRPRNAMTAAGPANHHGDPGPAGQRDLMPETARPPMRPQKEPSWPTVIATTIRLWWQRRGRRWRWAWVAALTGVVVVAASLAVALWH